METWVIVVYFTLKATAAETKLFYQAQFSSQAQCEKVKPQAEEEFWDYAHDQYDAHKGDFEAKFVCEKS